MKNVRFDIIGTKTWFELCVRLFLLHLKLLLTGIQCSHYLLIMLHLRELLKVISKLVTVGCARKIH